MSAKILVLSASVGAGHLRAAQATAEGAAYLKHFGVRADRLSVTGIPIHPMFSRSTPRRDCLIQHGLEGDRPIVLQLSGGLMWGQSKSCDELDQEEVSEASCESARNINSN
jgi:hypothetical protein